jgi:hypothetical protein
MGDFSLPPRTSSSPAPSSPPNAKTATGTSKIRASLDLVNVLSNNNGSFQIGGSGWFNTASNVGLAGQSLTAVLLNDNGQRIDGQINLNSWVCPLLASLTHLPTYLPPFVDRVAHVRKADAVFSLYLDSSRTTMGACRRIER